MSIKYLFTIKASINKYYELVSLTLRTRMPLGHTKVCSIVIPRERNANNFSGTKAGMQIIENFPFVFRVLFSPGSLFAAHGRKIE